MGGEQLPRASKYQRVGSCLLLLRENPYFRALRSDFWFGHGGLKLKTENVTAVKVQNVTISRQVSLLFDLEYSNIVLMGTVYISAKFRPDWTSNIAIPLETYFCIYLHINNTT
jgi:hypothetical protein